MGYDANFWLSVGCKIPLTPTAWPTLRRIFANPRVQSVLIHGGQSAFYPSRGILGAAASAAASKLCSSAQVADFNSKLQLHVTLNGTMPSPMCVEFENDYDDKGMNTKMRDIFEKIPGFDTDDDAPLTAAEHEDAVHVLESSFDVGMRSSFGAEALLFEFPLLRQSISVDCENFESEQHDVSVSGLAEQLASARRQMKSLGFPSKLIRVHSSMLVS